MSKVFKECPICGYEHDEDYRGLCMKCHRINMANVAVQEIEQKAEKTDDVSEKTKVKMVRICSCGTKNKANADFCIECNEYLGGITPVDEDQRHEVKIQPCCQLISIDGKYAFRIPIGETVIGRAYNMQEYLKCKTYVNRKHALIKFNGESLQIIDQNSKNGTYVNNQRIQKIHTLKNGDEICLGGVIVNGNRQEKAAYFQLDISDEQ